jgi:hypothetical protein
MNLENFKKTIKRRYRNGEDNIGMDFVAPCLKYTKLYRRGTGFFRLFITEVSTKTSKRG